MRIIHASIVAAYAIAAAAAWLLAMDYGLPADLAPLADEIVG